MPIILVTLEKENIQEQTRRSIMILYVVIIMLKLVNHSNKRNSELFFT